MKTELDTPHGVLRAEWPDGFLLQAAEQAEPVGVVFPMDPEPVLTLDGKPVTIEVVQAILNEMFHPPRGAAT